MALNKEIWIQDIVADFWPSNSFAVRSVDHSAFVTGKTVHVPNAGTAGSVTKNRNQFPAQAASRQDTDLSYNIDKFDVAPLHVPDLDAVELSYDLRSSILNQSKGALQNAVMEALLESWVPSGVTAIATSGNYSEEAHIATATGNRKAMTRADVLAVKKAFDKKDVPAEGRCLLLDAVMYNQLLNSLTDAETVSFVAGADPATGVVGRFLGFEVYMRSKVLKSTGAGSFKSWSTGATATDSAAGLAWQKDCVARALGSVEVFESVKDPLYYGDIISVAMRAGGSYTRADKSGVALIYQASGNSLDQGGNGSGSGSGSGENGGENGGDNGGGNHEGNGNPEGNGVEN